MQKIASKIAVFSTILLLMASSCTTLNKTMRESNTLVEFKKEDFVLTEQVTGTAKQIKVLGIDWGRIFKKEKGKTVSTPLIGGRTVPGKMESYALHDMLYSNMGYDVVFYPSYEITRLNILFLFTKTEVTVRARLGKLRSVIQ